MTTPTLAPRGNCTGRRSLDRLGSDPRVFEIYFDGGVYTLVPAPGYTCDPRGAHAAVEATVAGVIAAARNLAPCVCAECSEDR